MDTVQKRALAEDLHSLYQVTHEMNKFYAENICSHKMKFSDRGLLTIIPQIKGEISGLRCTIRLALLECGVDIHRYLETNELTFREEKDGGAS